MEEDCTLRILHLPPTLSDERREELFKSYGAVKTRTLRKSAKYTVTFVEFPNSQHASEMLGRLHQLPVNGRRLSVEFANKNVSVIETEGNVKVAETAENEPDYSSNKSHFHDFLKKLNSWAPHHMFSQPIPPFLRYKYPKPTKSTLLRIAMQLIKEPALYTQVLHLMNRMNLPPPFEHLEKKYPVLKEYYDVENYQDLFGVKVVPQNMEVVSNQEEQVIENLNENEPENVEDDEEEESEIESDEADVGPQQIIPEKRKKAQPKNRLKIPKFVNPLRQPVIQSTSSQKQRPQDIFELPWAEARKQKIIMKPVEQIEKMSQDSKESEKAMPFIVKSNENTEGFGLLFPAEKKQDDEEAEKDKPEFISTEQLHNNRISSNDQRVLPVYKNYHPGKPSCKLYLKNLSKQVEESDLHFIYKRYVLPSSSESETEYNVRLMQEGRMKGQAFVTLPNVAQGKLALEETNGYILKDKPMVVQFAKVMNS